MTDSDTIAIELIAGEDEVFVKETLDVLDGAARDLGRPFEPEPLHVRATDANGELVGGLVGYCIQGWLFVKFLAVSSGRRGGGIGARLLAGAEAEARTRGLAGVYLDTFEFQAPAFYVREGYDEIGRLPAARGAPQRIWFAKTFD